MTVVYCANRKIYPQLPTTINSLLQNNPNIEKIYLLIEDDSMSYINNPKIEFINCNNFDFLIRKGINCTKRFPYMATVRCFLAKILKEDKVIYLDIDTIVDGDLSELWSLNLNNNYIAAHFENRKINYINSGVLLMNLKLIRETKVDDVIIKLLKNCKFQFPDQDAMNLVFKNRILGLDSKFNKLGKDYVYNEDFIIRHWAGVIKPWKEDATELDKELWNKYKVEKI